MSAFLGEKKIVEIAYPLMRDRNEEAMTIAKHERLIRDTARPFTRLGVSLDDLLQEGRIALLQAYRNWDSTRGASVWTYARRFVLGAMFAAVGRALAIPLAKCGADPVPEDVEAELPDPSDARLLVQLLAVLTDDERELVRCYFVGEETLQQIADRKGMSMRGVHKRLGVAIEKMRAEAA